MLLEITQSEIIALLKKQLTNLFTYDPHCEDEALSAAIIEALGRCERCFSRSIQKRYKKDGVPCFSPWHSGQYAIFLYFVSNSLSRAAHGSLADRVYYLNKALNGIDLFHEITMPEYFALDHPVGSVLGRATYGDGFTFSHNCTVGNNHDVYPCIGVNVRMMSGSKILGGCNIGDNVILSANSYIKDMDIPPCSLVFGQYPNVTLKHRDESYFINSTGNPP